MDEIYILAIEERLELIIFLEIILDFKKVDFFRTFKFINIS